MLDAIVMDMDGTLLDPNNKILPETKEALIACQKQGTKLVLASGRSYTRLLSYAKELEMDVYGGYLLEVDGIAYYDVQKDERHVLKQMYKEDVEPVFAYLMHKNCETMAVFNDGLFDYIPDHIMEKKKALRNSQEYPEDFPWTGGPWSWLADMRDGYPKITYIQDLSEIKYPVNKIQTIEDEEVTTQLALDIQNEFKDQYEVFRTCPRELEVLPKGYSKGATLVRMMDMFGWDRKKAALVNCVIILIASMPCVLGYNVWSDLHLIGGRDVLDSEDFIVSNLLLPGGSLIYLLFCVTKWGWGFDNYLEEANTGKGLKIAKGLKPYFQFVLPVLILFILIQGLI